MTEIEDIRQAFVENSEDQDLMEQVIDSICQVYDPEIPVNIWELGLIYVVEMNEARQVKVTMSLTTPMCPSAQELPLMVEDAVCYVEGVQSCDVEIVWEPPWHPSMMSDVARVQLNFF